MKRSPTFTSLLFSPSLREWKIGKSKYVPRRLKGVRRCRDAELFCVFDFEKFPEPFLHKKFSSLRTDGEWFSDSPRIRRFLEKNRASFVDPSKTGDRQTYLMLPNHLYHVLKRMAQRNYRTMSGQVYHMIEKRLLSELKQKSK